MKIFLVVLITIVLVIIFIIWWQHRHKSKIYKFFISILPESKYKDSIYDDMWWNKDGSKKSAKHKKPQNILNKNGLNKIFHTNGNIQQQFTMLNGTYDGLKYDYSSEGHMVLKSLYIRDRLVWKAETTPDGILSGIKTEYDGDGYKAKESLMVEGKMVRVIKKYNQQEKSKSLKDTTDNGTESHDWGQRDYRGVPVEASVENVDLNNDVSIAKNILFPGLKGVNLNQVEYNSTDLGKSLSEDIDGKWYFTQKPMVMLMKTFSEELIISELEKLLNANRVQNFDLNQDDSSWSIQVDNHLKVGNKSTIIFERNNNTIQIINASVADSDSIELRETELAPIKEGINWVVGLKIYDGAGFFKDNKDIFLVRNVPLFFNDNDLDYILIPCVPHLSIAKNIIDNIVKLNGGDENYKKIEEKNNWKYVYGGANFLIGYITDQHLVRINRNNTKVLNLKQLDENLNLISEQWAQILKSRASWRKMSIENLKMSFWDMAMGHTEEYMLKYKNDDMDIEGITYRIDILHSFIDEYEKYFKDRMERGNSTSEHIFNDFLAVVESLIGAEITILKMVDAGESYDTSELYKRKDRPNSDNIKDVNDSNTDFEDILDYSYHKGYLFNGNWMGYDEKENLLYETPFRFGLKHGTGKEFDESGNLKTEILYFNDKPIKITNIDGEKSKSSDDNNVIRKQKDNSKNSNKNSFLEKIDKLEAFSNFTDIQIRNTQITVFCSAIWQLINVDDKLTEEESSQFIEFAKEMSHKYLGDDNDKNDPVIAELMQDPDKMIGVIKTFPEDELEFFWDTLFSFAMVDGEFSFEEANLIGLIASGVYENLSSDEIKKWMENKLSKS
jgi:antitoxin component YwqK of YwqJK toxin-antitoxin module